jgi:hypothetical protein
MDADKTGQPKIERPHAFFDKPQEVVIDPALSKEQKKQALAALEQDARQLSSASAEGMAGGEPSKLQDVLDAGDSLELPPTAYAYAVVLKDLRSKLTTDVTGDARAVVERALAALAVVARSFILESAAGVPGSGADGEPKPDSVTAIDEEIAREKLDP